MNVDDQALWDEIDQQRRAVLQTLSDLQREFERQRAPLIQRLVEIDSLYVRDGMIYVDLRP